MQTIADVVVAFPGRLLDHIRRRTVDLSHVEVLVPDEADQMFDMGFLPDIRRILSHVSHVINYDMPSTPETYIHRIGRTGRDAAAKLIP